MHEPCHTYECVISLIRLSHVTHLHESWPTYQQPKKYCTIWMSHVHKKKKWISHATHDSRLCHTSMHEAWHTHTQVTNPTPPY